MSTPRLASIVALLCTLLSCTATRSQPVRYGMVIGLKTEAIERYEDLHANPWPAVLDQLDRSHLRDFSIWTVELRPGEHYLFGYFTYDGDDFDADMAIMAEDAETKRWWLETDPCQVPIPTAGEGEQWTMMREVFFHDRGRRGAPLTPAPVRPGASEVTPE
jgi:L-rhamnose mutarotase